MGAEASAVCNSQQGGDIAHSGAINFYQIEFYSKCNSVFQLERVRTCIFPFHRRIHAQVFLYCWSARRKLAALSDLRRHGRRRLQL